MNAGVVLYDLARMRERKFEAETLKAVSGLLLTNLIQVTIIIYYISLVSDLW